MTFVDQQAAKLRNHKTQTELRRTIKRSTIPHISYDIDGDGVVNQSDMQVARWIDVDGKERLHTTSARKATTARGDFRI